MSSPSRRGFLKRLLAMLPAWAVLPPVWRMVGRPDEGTGATLEALAEVVLPRAELGADGVAEAVSLFRRWCAGFEPGAELDHPYLWSDDLRYGPSDPRPRWTGQLEALESESVERYERSFHEVELVQRLELVTAQLPSDMPERVPPASEASHVATALASWFFSTPLANDLCYRAAIGRHSCRGLPGVEKEPAPREDWR